MPIPASPPDNSSSLVNDISAGAASGSGDMGARAIGFEVTLDIMWREGAGAGVKMACGIACGLAVHSAMDFNLHIPANVLAAVTVVHYKSGSHLLFLLLALLTVVLHD